MSEKEKIHRTTIGGQALIEGIMMKGPEKTAMAVRTKEGEIVIEEKENKQRKWYNKAPFIRGTINFVSQLLDGYYYLSRSAELSGMADDDGEEEMSKFEKWLDNKFGDKIMGVIMTIAMIFGIALAILLFVFVPTWLFMLVQYLVGTAADLSPFQSLFEGILKIAIFITYMWIVSKTESIRRTYEYHGAEHKTIACYEHGLELTVENVKPQIRFHPRCGTSFIFLVLLISILIYSIFPITNQMFIDTFAVSEGLAMILRVSSKILLLPVIVSISYEVIRLAGRYDNVLTKIISAPGLWLQRLTTKEPDDSEIEAAIAAMNAVIPDDKESDKW
ncbi:MAG TPA: DUF1385 domain-containing protein [Ruminococcaceae bacterium]|nr:DUF1385 domain-containing protein [Oscillospiraceae bacterium]